MQSKQNMEQKNVNLNVKKQINKMYVQKILCGILVHVLANAVKGEILMFINIWIIEYLIWI